MVNSLVTRDKPLHVLKRSLACYGFESSPLVDLLPENIISILTAYIKGHVCATDVEEWAEFIEGRDDIRFFIGSGVNLVYTVFELANDLGGAAHTGAGGTNTSATKSRRLLKQQRLRWIEYLLILELGKTLLRGSSEDDRRGRNGQGSTLPSSASALDAGVQRLSTPGGFALTTGSLSAGHSQPIRLKP